MQDFFRGWKRKLGVVVLLLACLLTAGWIQTYSACDMLILKRFSVASLDSTLGIILQTQPTAQWHTMVWQHTDGTDIDSVLSDDSEWKWRFLGFGYASIPNIRTTSVVFIPYWQMVAPLALFAAFLLRSKPRPAAREKV